MDETCVKKEVITDRYAIYNGDSCEILPGIPSNSVHFEIYSPPFASLYTYSNSERDLGNCKSDSEFFEHFEFIIKELYRVLMPGRIMAVQHESADLQRTRRVYRNQRFPWRSDSRVPEGRFYLPFGGLHLEGPCDRHAAHKSAGTFA